VKVPVWCREGLKVRQERKLRRRLNKGRRVSAKIQYRRTARIFHALDIAHEACPLSVGQR
jgi:hypothetical protein